MLIPIGLDQNEVRRLPWITFALIAINVVVFLATGMGGTSNEAAAGRAWEKVITYWTSHPYLEPPQELVKQQPSERAKEEFEAFVEVLRQMNQNAPDSQAERAAEQEELNNLVHQFLSSIGEHPFHKWGLHPTKLEVSAFLTCMFIHAGWLHLIGNMLILYLGGPFVEDAFGRPLFAGLYLSAGVVASLSHVLMFPTSDSPLGGASGAIAGVMGAFLIRFAKTKIRFFYWFALVLRGTFDAPAWLMLPLWLAEQLFMGSMGSEGGTAYWAHVGGFAWGLALAFAVRHFKIEQKYIAPAIEAQISVTQHPALDEGLALLGRGDATGAREAIRRALADDPRNMDAHLAMWHCCTAEGRAAEGVENMARVVEDELRRNEVALALAHWREMFAATGSGGPGPLRSRLAAAAEASEPDMFREILRSLAADPSAGLLQEKATKKLAAMGETVAPPPPPPPVAAAPPPPPDEPGLDEVFTAPVTVEPWIVEITALLNLQPDGLVVQGTEGGTEMLPFMSVRAIAVAGIAAQPRPYLLIDLLLRGDPAQPTRVVRMFSTSFDPRRLLGKPEMPPMAAFRSLITVIAEGAGGPVVPGEVVAEGRFTTYPSVEAYEAAILAALC